VERELLTVQRLVRLADGGDVARGKAAPAQALAVGSMRSRRVPGHGHEGRHVLAHDRSRGDHRVHADAAELVHADKAAKHGIIADDDVAGELRIVRKRRVVADDAVVGDMGVGEQQVAIADGRRAAVLHRSGMYGHVFADDVVGADERRRRLPAILAILRYLAHRGELENAVAGADVGAAGNDHVAGDDRPGADLDLRADDAERPDPDVRREPGCGGHQGRGVDVLQLQLPMSLTAAMSTARVTSSPSTLALAANLYTLRTTVSSSASSSS